MAFKETIERHINIEYLCNNMLNEGLLLEKHGLFDGAEEITDRIIKEAEENIKKGELFFSVNDIDTFFGKLNLDFLITIMDYKEKRSGKGGYRSSESKYNPKTKKMENINLLFNLKLYPQESIEHYRALFYNELTHIYEDWNRRKNGVDSLNIYNKKLNYYSNDFQINDNTIWVSVKRTIYFLNNAEGRAYIAMIKGILDNNKNLYTPQQCYNKIKSEKPYQFYVDVEKYINDIKRCEDIELQKEIVEYFQTHGYPKIKTFSGLCKSLDKVFFNFMQKLGKTTGKMIFDYLENLKEGTEDWGKEF